MRASSPDVKTLLVKAGDKVELDCSAVGHPNTEIFWYKYNIPLLDITYRKLEDTLESRKLVLDNVLLADSGNYSCHKIEQYTGFNKQNIHTACVW